MWYILYLNGIYFTIVWSFNINGSNINTVFIAILTKWYQLKLHFCIINNNIVKYIIYLLNVFMIY